MQDVRGLQLHYSHVGGDEIDSCPSLSRKLAACQNASHEVTGVTQQPLR